MFIMFLPAKQIKQDEQINNMQICAGGFAGESQTDYRAEFVEFVVLLCVSKYFFLVAFKEPLNSSWSMFKINLRK